jgi:putative NADH-flavin reductase
MSPSHLLLLLSSLLLGGGVSAFSAFGGSSLGARRGSPSSLRMAIAVFGGSGLTGSECVYQLLQRGEEVVTLSRRGTIMSPLGSTGSADQPLTDPKLTNIQGSVTSKSDVKKVFEAKGITGVIIALGGKTSDVGLTMLTDGTRNIIQEMKSTGVKKVACVTSIGCGDSESQAPFFFKVLMWTAMKNIFTDKNNQEALFTKGEGADLDWCIVRPGGLTVDPPTGVVNVIEGEAGSIPRADVADFCIGAVVQDGFPYTKKAPCISSVGGTSWTKDRSAKARMG